jgi:putative CocE/NonD family hydrolase
MATEPEGRITGEMDCGSVATWNYSEEMLSWFNYWLKGHPNQSAERADVRYFVMGANEWRDSSDWPPPGIVFTRYYLNSDHSGTARSLNDGSLRTAPPSRPSPPASYMHDPSNPVPSLGGAALFNLSPNESTTAEHWADLNAQAGSRDLRPIEGRCLTFTSEPLPVDLEVTGPVRATIYFNSTAVDADLVVRLSDVHPDGRSMLLCDGIQRARYRKSPFRSELLTPQVTVEVKVDLWATSNLFFKGHRIRVVISGSCYPRFDINPGTGQSMLARGPMIRSENRIHVEPGMASFIELPILSVSSKVSS